MSSSHNRQETDMNTIQQFMENKMNKNGNNNNNNLILIQMVLIHHIQYQQYLQIIMNL